MLVTIIMPCLNEETTLRYCIKNAKNFLSSTNIDGEILIVDNGSIDKSVEIANQEKVRVVIEPNKGYGNALKRGIKEAKGKYIIIGDCDGSYDFMDSIKILCQLKLGYDFVCGNRFKGGIEKGAMPLSHRIGVPLLSIIAKIKYRVPINDFHCGLRGFRSELAKNIAFNTTGMEFATELVYKFKDTKMMEVPIKLHKDLRGHKSHLRTIPDGIRHLKFILFKGGDD